MLDGTRKFSLVDESNKEMKRTLTTVYDALKEMCIRDRLSTLYPTFYCGSSRTKVRLFLFFYLF